MLWRFHFRDLYRLLSGLAKTNDGGAPAVVIGGLGVWPLYHFLMHADVRVGSTEEQMETLFIFCLVGSQFAANAAARAEPTR